MTHHPATYRQHAARQRLARSPVIIEASERFLGLPPPIVDLPDRHEPDEPPRRAWWRRVREWFRAG